MKVNHLKETQVLAPTRKGGRDLRDLSKQTSISTIVNERKIIMISNRGEALPASNNRQPDKE